MPSGIADKNGSGRVYGFDVVKEILVVFGVIFHTNLLFYDVSDDCALQLEHPIVFHFIKILIWLTHVIRMPQFFLISGYVSQSLLKYKGDAFFAANRYHRLLRPLLASLILILPITDALDEYHYDAVLDGAVSPMKFIFSIPASLYQTLIRKPSLNFLWFLVYLYAFSILLRLLSKYDLSRSLRFFTKIDPVYWLFIGGTVSMMLMKVPFDVRGSTHIFVFAPFLYYAGYFFFGSYLHFAFAKKKPIHPVVVFLWIPCTLLYSLVGFDFHGQTAFQVNPIVIRTACAITYSLFATSVTLAVFKVAFSLKVAVKYRPLVVYF